MRFFPGVTTTSSGLDGARAQIKEALALGIRECGLFLTCLDSAKRRCLYRELKEVRGRIAFPFVHARSDMSEDEFFFLMEKFDTERFNLHPLKERPLLHGLGSDIRDRIYIENLSGEYLLNEADLPGFAGICLDISHLEDLRRNDPDTFVRFRKLLDNIAIGANHISAIAEHPRLTESCPQYSRHRAESLNQFSYLAKFPDRYFSDYCAVELENSISEQLHVIKAIEFMVCREVSAEAA